MKKYKVFVRGENFLLNLEREGQKCGFHTTCFVEAQNGEAAEEEAVAMLRDDPKLRRSVRNDRSDPPMMFVEEITELESFQESQRAQHGLRLLS